MGGREEREGEARAEGGRGTGGWRGGPRAQRRRTPAAAGCCPVTRWKTRGLQALPWSEAGVSTVHGVRQNLHLRSAGPAAQGSKGGDGEAERVQGKDAAVCS